MSRQLKATLYYLSADIRYPLSVFWAILVGLLILSVVSTLVAVSLNNADMSMSFNLAAPIYFFAAIVGFLTVKTSIPYLIKMGSTRKNIYLAIGIHFFSLALFNAIIANLLQLITSFFLHLQGVNMGSDSISITYNEQIFTFNHIADIISNTWMSRILVDTSIAFFLLAVMFIVGLIFFRFGLVGGFTFLAIGISIFIIGITYGSFLQFFINIFKNINYLFFIQLFLVGLVTYLLSIILLRKITIT